MDKNHFDKSSQSVSQEDLRNAFRSVEDAYIRDKMASDYPSYAEYLDKTQGPLIEEGKRRGQRDSTKINPVESAAAQKALDQWTEHARQKYRSAVSIAKWHSINDLLTSADNSTFLVSRKFLHDRNANGRKQKFKEQDLQAFEVYRSAGNHVFDEILNLQAKNTQYFLGRKTADDLVYERANSVVNKQGIHSILEGYKHIQDTGKMVFMDTETWSGRNRFGMNQTDAITEFNFRVVTRDKSGKWDLSRNSSDNEGKVFKSIIGSTQDQFEHNEALIARYERGDKTLSELDMVTLRRLALTGHKNTTYHHNSQGVYNFSTFAGPEDVAGMHISDMRRGNRAMRDIGIGQEKAPLIKFGKYQVRGWEAELLKGLDLVFNQNVTMAGFNTVGFDNPAFATFLKRGNVTEGFRKAYMDMTGGSFTPKYQYDLLMALRASGISRNELYSRDEWKELEKSGLTSFQQEALTFRKSAGGHEAVYKGLNAHMADTDTFVGSHLIVNTPLMSELGLKQKAESYAAPSKILGGGQQLYMATSGQQITGRGLWGFRQDAFTGQIRTTDGYAIDADGAITSEIMDQYLFKKEVAYTPTTIQKFSGDSKFANFLGRLNPDWNKNGLYAVTFNAVVNGEAANSYMAQSPVTIVGTRDMIEQYMGANMFHVANKNKAGKWVAADDKQMRQALSLKVINDDGTHRNFDWDLAHSQGRDESKFINNVIANGSNRIMYESAARAAREFNYKKDAGILSYLQDETAFATGKDGIYRPEEATMFRQIVRENTEALLSKIATGQPLEEDDLRNTYHSYFGFRDLKSKKPKVFTETVSSQLARVEHIRRNQYLYETAMRHARQRVGLSAEPKSSDGKNYWFSDVSGDNKHRIDAYYKMYARALENAAIEKNGEKIARNMQNQGTYAYSRNAFEINLKGYRPDIVGDKYIKIGLEGAGVNLANRILRAHGVDTETRHIDPADQVAELRNLQKWLIKQGVLGDAYRQKNRELGKDSGAGLRIQSTDAYELAAQKFMSSLKAEREKNAWAGIDKDTYRYSIVNQAIDNKNLSKDEIDVFVQAADKSIPNLMVDNGADDVKHHAKKVTEEILFNGNKKEDIKAELRKAGYSEKQIAYQMEALARREEDTKKFVTGLFNAAVSNGISIGYDTKQKNVFMVYNGEQLDLTNLLPKDVFEGGMFSTKIGATSTASPLGLYDVRGNLEYGSLIRKAAFQEGGMRYLIRNGVEEGRPLDKVEYILKQVAKNLRQSSSVDKKDAQDRKASMYFNYKDAIEHISELPLNDIDINDPDAIKILDDLKNGKKRISADKVDTATRLSTQLIRKQIIMAGLHATGAGILNISGIDVEKDLRFDTKHAGEYVATFDSMHDFGEDYGSTKRGIHNQVSRSVQFNQTAAERAFSEFEDNYGIRFGQAIQSAQRAEVSRIAGEGIGYEVNRVIRAKRAALGTETLRNVINSYARQNLADDYSIDLLSSIHLAEGSAAIDPRLADRVFSYRDSMQKIGLAKVFETDMETFQHLKEKSNADFHFSINEGTNLTFSYGDGAFVNGGSEILTKVGMDGAPEPIRAKQTGIMRLGVFTHDGKLADTETINRLLNSVKVSKGMNAEQLEAAKEQAFRLLQKNYNLSYYVQSLDAGTNIKVAEMSAEKNMMRAMMATTGAINKDIRDFLDQSGLKAMKDMSLNIDIIDSLKSENFSKSAFAIAAVGMSGKTAEELEQAIKSKFGTTQEFHKLLMEERYKPWKHLLSAMRGANILGKDELVHVVSNNFKGELKHQDAKAVVNRITDNLLEQKGATPESVIGILTKAGAITNLKLNDHGEIVSSADTVVNLSNLRKVVEDNLSDNVRHIKIKNKNGEIIDGGIADVAMSEFAQEHNYDNGRIYAQNGSFQKAIKLNHRAAMVLSMQRMSETRKGRIKTALSGALGSAGQKLYDELISGYQEGDIVSKHAIQYIKNNIYTRPGDKPSEIAHVRDGKMFIGKHMERVLADSGISKEKAQIVADVAQKAGATAISKRIIEERYSAQSHASAFNFNKDGGAGIGDIEAYAQNRDMNIIHADELAMPHNAESASKIMESAFGKESILDLHLVGSDEQLYDKVSGLGRYIYLPYAPVRAQGDGVTQTPYQKSLGRLHRYITEYNERIAGKGDGPLSDEDREKLFVKMKNAADQIKEDIRVSLTGKNGLVANMTRANIEDSGIFTAYGNELFGGEESKFFTGLNFDFGNGHKVNLVEQAKLALDPKNIQKSLDFDYTILSKKAMHEFYGDKMLSRLGIKGTELESAFMNAMDTRLTTGGTMALNVREPQGYAKSTSVSMLFFSDIVADDQAIVGAIGHESKKGDYDSDKVEAALLKQEALININGKKRNVQIDQATFDVLNSMEGVTASWTDQGKAMNNYKASILVNAESNKLWRMKSNALKDGLLSYSGDHLANYTIEGNVNGTLAPRLNISDEKEATRLRSYYKDLENQAREYYKYKSSVDFDKVSDDEKKLKMGLGAHQRNLIYQMVNDKKYQDRFGLEGAAANEHVQNVRNALHMKLSDDLNHMEAITDSLKLGAGEMNYQLYAYLQVAQNANAVGAEDFNKIMQIHTALGEAYLSPKNESGSRIDRITRLRNAYGHAYDAMEGHYDRRDAANELKDAIKEVLYDRSGNEMARLHGMLSDESIKNLWENGIPDKASKDLIDDAIDAYSTRMINNVNLTPGYRKSLYDFGVTKGFTNEKSRLAMAEGSEGMLQEGAAAINAQQEAMGQEKSFQEVKGARKAMQEALDEASIPSEAVLSSWKEPLEYSIADTPGIKVSGIAHDVVKAASEMHLPKGTAFGSAVAVAGGLLLSGYTSSSAPAPAETQADGAQQEFRDMYSTSEVPSFSDGNMNTMRMNSNARQGYVINISAKTDDGRQQAIDAINSAVGGAVPQASSINIAMNTSFADKISQFQIDKMVANAF